MKKVLISKNPVQNISWKDISFKKKTPYGKYLPYIVLFKGSDLEGSLILQWVKFSEAYTLHIEVPEELQKLGLASKIIKAAVFKFNKQLILTEGRFTNKNMFKVLDKLKLDPDLTLTNDKYGQWFLKRK